MDFGQILNPGNLTKKYGPLPLYGWVGIAVVVVGGGYYLYRKFHPASAAASSTSGLQCPPGYQADPTGQYCVPTGASVSPSASGSSGGGGAATVDRSGLQSLLNQFQTNLATTLGGFSGGSVGAGSGTGTVNANPPGSTGTGTVDQGQPPAVVTQTPAQLAQQLINEPNPITGAPNSLGLASVDPVTGQIVYPSQPPVITQPSVSVPSSTGGLNQLDTSPIGSGAAAFAQNFLSQPNPITGAPNSLGLASVNPATGQLNYPSVASQPIAPNPTPISVPGIGTVPAQLNLMPIAPPPLLLPAPGPAYGPQNQPAYYVGSNGLNYAPVQAPGSTVIGPPSAPGPFANPQNVLTVLGPGG